MKDLLLNAAYRGIKYRRNTSPRKYLERLKKFDIRLPGNQTEDEKVIEMLDNMVHRQ